MASLIISNYQKPGAVFASAQEAHDDKNSLFPEDLKASILAASSSMLADNVITKPNTLQWDPETHTLSVVKYATGTKLEYYDNRNIDSAASIDYAQSAGWTYLGDQVVSE
jgi:hypothetical protein